MSAERIDVLAVPGHSSAEVATWTAQQAIAFMAAEMKTYRPDIEAKCNEARAAVAELIAADEALDAIDAELPCAPEAMPDPQAYLRRRADAVARRAAALARVGAKL